jgi:hypothetical protein
MADVLALLWDPLPDPLPVPEPRRLRRLRHLLATAAAEAATSALSEQERTDRRVRRGCVQALVREAYQRTLAEQDTARRRPAAFAQAWKTHLASLLDQASVDLPGWSEVTIADVDVELAWTLYAVASHARQHAVEHASATPSKRVRLGWRQTSTFEFAIVGDGASASLGEVTYGICPPCRIGLLYKIEFSPDWQSCGLGTLALSQLETRHPDLTWHTTGQFNHARAFYNRYREGSASPWTMEQHLCPHFE